MRIIATALIEWSSHNCREAVDSWFKTELSGVASRRSVVARLTGPAGGRNEPRCEVDVWHPFGYRPDDSIRRGVFFLAISRGKSGGENFSPSDHFFLAGHAPAGGPGVFSPIFPKFFVEAGAGSRLAWLGGICGP